LMIRNIYLKFEVDTLRNDKVIVKNILLHQNFNLKSGRGRGRRASRTALHILRIVELKTVRCVKVITQYMLSLFSHVW
jgi:hypothetical protein